MEEIKKRTFKFDKRYCNIFLRGSVCFGIFTIASILMFKGQNNAIIGTIFFGIVTILILLWWLHCKLFKVIYQGGYFIKYGIIRKTYCLKDVKKVIIWPVTTKGVTMYFNNGKLNLHPFLSNYEDIEKILKMNTGENIIDNKN